MKLGIFDSGEQCATCGGYTLLFSGRTNASFERDLLDALGDTPRWNLLKKRRQEKIAQDIRQLAAELREQTLHA